MTQQSLFPIDLVDPAEVEPEDARIARLDAIDRFNERHLRDFWNRKRAVIEASGDTVRLKLLMEHDDREAQRMRGQAA
jgi:hypothetical protein